MSLKLDGIARGDDGSTDYKYLMREHMYIGNSEMVQNRVIHVASRWMLFQA